MSDKEKDREASPEIASHVVVPQRVTPARLQPYDEKHPARKRVINNTYGNGDSMGLLGSGTGARTEVQSVAIAVDRPGTETEDGTAGTRRCVSACVRGMIRAFVPHD